jgi:transglutaminase-like putative cysteine protease
VTAADVNGTRFGVCRDFTHLAISFCRALNIPARYVFGYLPDLDIPDDGAEMDFAAWMEVARRNPARLFYAYTKSLPFWIARKNTLPPNFRLTASRGGKHDELIDEHGLPDAQVVFHPEEAGDLKLDTDDSLAKAASRDSFALLLQGQQPAGSRASAALKRMRKENIEYSYSK